MMSRILPVVLILAAIGIFFGYINPAYTGHVHELQAEIASYDAALAAADRFAEKEGELLTQKGSIPEDGLARVEAFLPDGVDNVQLILDLNALASRSGLKLSNFNVEKTDASQGGSSSQLSLASDGPVSSLTLSVGGTGTYAAFKTFLQGVEASLRPLDLVALDLKNSDTGVYQYSMKFRIYWLR